MKKEIKLEIDLDKFRYSLVGDGYILEEVDKMSEEELVSILEDRIDWHIEKEYQDGKRMGLFDDLK
jgi:hypothetical protein